MSDDPNLFVSSEVPLYYQISNVLREKIASGAYQDGQQLPTLPVLAEGYGVSRLTIREALRHLEQEGFVRRARGRGTFVTYKSPFADNMSMDGSIEDLISMGMSTSVKLLDMKQLELDADEARVLGFEERQVVRCRRLRFFHNEPYCYIVNTVPHDLGERIERSHWEEGSVLKYIEEGLGVPLRESRQRIRAALADPVLARWLQVKVGAPLLQVDYLILSDDDRLVEQARLYYRSDAYSFSINLTRDSVAAKKRLPWALKDHRIERS